MAWFDRNKHRYPVNWTEIAKAVKERAGWQCEACGNPHGKPPYVLTVHHLNHDPGDCSERNLLACCQSCHLKCQSLRPRPLTKADAIRRLQEWIKTRDANQLTLEGIR
jgi:hypothetical protein